MSYALNMPGFNIRPPNFDFSGLADLGESVGRIRTGMRNQEIGELVSGGKLKEAEAAAYGAGDFKLGDRVRGMREQQASRAAAASSAQAKAAAEAKSASFKGELGKLIADGRYEDAERMAWTSGDFGQATNIRNMRLAEQNKSAAASEAEKKAAASRDEQAQRFVREKLVTLDPNDPEFGKRWQERLGLMRRAGYQVPPDYDDPKAGYDQMLIETLGPKGFIERRDEIRKAGSSSSPAAYPWEGMGMTEDGRVIRAEADDQPTRSVQVLGSSEEAEDPLPSVETTGGIQFGEVGRDASTVPGIVISPDGKRSDQFATKRLEQQRAVAGASSEDQQRLREVWENQQRWTAVFGKAPSGKFYGPNGELLDQAQSNLAGKPSSSFAAASQGVREVAMESIDDALSRVQQGSDGSFFRRAAEMTLGTGEYARMNRTLDLAVKGVAHGMSGAAMSYKEIESYLNTFMPQPLDARSTIEFKLAHLKRAIGAIQAVTTGSADKKMLHELRNEMRDGMGLKPLPFVAEQKVDPLTRKPVAPTRAPDPASMSDEELLRRLSE